MAGGGIATVSEGLASMEEPAVIVRQLTHHYGSRQALDHLSLDVMPAELFAILGPNGGGKTTLFRVLSTLLPPQQGQVSILGFDVSRDQSQVRGLLGVVFQSPSLDHYLTVEENLSQQAALYGITRRESRNLQDELLDIFGLLDRRREYVKTLSGGLRRRVELAKGMINRPKVLLLDEPSTGLDPGARLDVWHYLVKLRESHGVTVILTTHLLEEADKADRVAILDTGRLVVLDQPAKLKDALGGDSLLIETDRPEHVSATLASNFGMAPVIVDGVVRIEQAEGHVWVPRLVEALPGEIRSIRLGQPTLEDVFVHRTGHQFWSEEPE